MSQRMKVVSWFLRKGVCPVAHRWMQHSLLRPLVYLSSKALWHVPPLQASKFSSRRFLALWMDLEGVVRCVLFKAVIL